MKIRLSVMSLLIVTLHAFSAEPLKVNKREFSLYLDKTRVIYNQNDSSQSLSAVNKQAYPVLLQAKIMPVNKDDSVNFIVTPPISRLDPGQQVSLRIIKNKNIDEDKKESMSYLCINTLPPEKSSNEKGEKNVGINLNVLISTCEKLIYRPSSLSGSPQTVGAKLSWQSDGGKIIIHNPTPFIMSIGSLTVNGKKVILDDYISPQGSLSVNESAEKGSTVKWTVIADYGGESAVFTTKLK
ncbi:fimbria/pilus periplasmic chaperone [Rosenbergiella nectarea]|uniref:fimbria/pilus periplasmic chaperone n=1 Tax=Rosenbergiella nectarea TaxID=988801 RepID=UPI001F4F0F89|nr:fimbria/pilus periplasmic chaperone [Rosenbergiella nectarea]